MTPSEIKDTTQRLIEQIKEEPTVGMYNYRTVISDYRQILNDTLVLVRELSELWITQEQADKIVETIITESQKT